MEHIEFRVPPRCDLSDAEPLVEQACAELGLTVATKGSLATVPGSVHWHFKQPKQKGTLELTLVAVERRIWAQIHSNRKGPWMDALLPRLRQEIERALGRPAEIDAADPAPRRLQ